MDTIKTALLFIISIIAVGFNIFLGAASLIFLILAFLLFEIKKARTILFLLWAIFVLISLMT